MEPLGLVLAGIICVLACSAKERKDFGRMIGEIIRAAREEINR